MGERLERLGEVRIVEETDCFGLDFVQEMERMFRSTAPDMAAVLKRRLNLRFVDS